jgi:hypothetical protein
MMKPASPPDEAPQPDVLQIEPHTADNKKPERYDPWRDPDVLLSGHSISAFLEHERHTNERLKLAEENERLKLAEENERLKPERRKLAALKRELKDRWLDIESDFRHAETNGLKAAAWLPEQHGYWNLTAALKWAKENGKLTDKATVVPQESKELNPMEAINRLSMGRRRK